MEPACAAFRHWLIGAIARAKFEHRYMLKNENGRPLPAQDNPDPDRIHGVSPDCAVFSCLVRMKHAITVLTKKPQKPLSSGDSSLAGKTTSRFQCSRLSK